MKKSILLGMPKLTASPEMKKVALEDEPEKLEPTPVIPAFVASINAI